MTVINIHEIVFAIFSVLHVFCTRCNCVQAGETCHCDSQLAVLCRDMCSGEHISWGNTYHCNTGYTRNARAARYVLFRSPRPHASLARAPIIQKTSVAVFTFGKMVKIRPIDCWTTAVILILQSDPTGNSGWMVTNHALYFDSWSLLHYYYDCSVVNESRSYITEWPRDLVYSPTHALIVLTVSFYIQLQQQLEDLPYIV